MFDPLHFRNLQFLYFFTQLLFYYLLTCSPYFPLCNELLVERVRAVSQRQFVMFRSARVQSLLLLSVCVIFVPRDVSTVGLNSTPTLQCQALRVLFKTGKHILQKSLHAWGHSAFLYAQSLRLSPIVLYDQTRKYTSYNSVPHYR